MPLKLLKLQTLLYHNEAHSIRKFIECLKVIQVPVGWQLFFHLGDCSVEPLLDKEQLAQIEAELSVSDVSFKYTFFNENLGFGKGHNRLFQELPDCEAVIILNPDTVFPYHFFSRLVAMAETHPDYGIIEARQYPLEHPKAFDYQTYEGAWASMACSLVKYEAFKRCNGFDENIFLYAEDTDISWRIRALGYKIYYCPNGWFYHVKRLNQTGLVASKSELFYSPIYSLMLQAKYGREDLNENALAWLKRNTEPINKAILEGYEKALENMTPATPEERKVARFEGSGFYAHHRWKYDSFRDKFGRSDQL
ncbi:MAG: hypothetical protein HXX08_12035 [Chloroflexi bacterium]|uniref:Glycosyltransferase family 2 protein n=1 Tax=Candidatus Chlorohelix allophototropha TaxID=3003348 RepID=A0A8T7M2X6_9CHLR|nr:hypothetical protein [Chloroflexota bacterium]WJW65971.1 hypothetical protein OZ401_001751 [Chloroflexota bacterium L227-S17]